MFREERLYDQILDTGRRLGKRLITVDQTLINLVLHQRIQPLRWKYNVRLGFDEPPYSGDGLAHFVGALKPWDPFARWLHGNASLWENWAQKAGEGMQSLGQKVSRGIKLGPVYARAWRARLA
jgi:lipopolysaccharide biosynthesis glycosyltransferase